jgi:hypothetical protein
MLPGFMYLHTLFLTRGRLESTWSVLKTFGAALVGRWRARRGAGGGSGAPAGLGCSAAARSLLPSKALVKPN